MTLTEQLRPLLAALEQELQRANLYSETPPSAAQLASTVPFSADVMPFELWLQFIFIPRMNQMLELQLPLPQAMAISPMAQMVYADAQPKLLGILQQIDALFTDPQQ